MKIVYIAHPIAGNVEENLADLVRIIRRINLEAKVIPFCPYYADVMALDDKDPKQRQKGIRNSTAILKSGACDEMWLTGFTISEGMMAERKLAEEIGLPVHDFINLL